MFRPTGFADLAGRRVGIFGYGVEGRAVAERLRGAGIDAFIDTHGSGYVKLAIELGVAPDRIDTIIDFAAAQQYEVKAEGSQAALTAGLVAELAGLVATGELEVPIAATFPLAEVRAAFKLLEEGHTRGKILLLPLLTGLWLFQCCRSLTCGSRRSVNRAPSACSNCRDATPSQARRSALYGSMTTSLRNPNSIVGCVLVS